MSLAIANLTEILDGREIGAFQKRVVALCAAIAFVDGIEGQLAGYIAPALRQDMGLSPSELVQQRYAKFRRMGIFEETS